MPIIQAKRALSHYRSTVLVDMTSTGISRWRWRYRFTKRTALFVRVLRRCEALRPYKNSIILGALYFWTRWRLSVLSERMGFDIPLGVFGPGLSIAHRGNIVVNGNARVGRNCRIHQGVTIGAVKDAAPQIGDDVFIGPNSGIYGGIVIGDGVKVGPHSLVNEDIPAGSVIYAPRGSVRESNDNDVRNRA